MLQNGYRKLWFLGLVALLLSFGVMRAGVQAAQPDAPPTPLQATVGAAVHADVSAPLREMARLSQTPTGGGDIPETNLRLPRPWQIETLTGDDPVRQSILGPLAMPAPLYSFDGVGNVNGVHPPDTQGDIGYDPAPGTKYYVQWVNLSYAIWDVTGATPVQLLGPVAGNTLWQGFGGPCQSDNHGDPITLFDPIANRWLMSQFSVDGPYYQCIAVSQTANPTGAWYRYAFQVSATKMNDYPHFGVWPDGYYMTVNQFTGGSSWGGAGVFVFDRSKMLVGDTTATFQSFDLYSVNSDFGGMLPSDLDGSTLPPTGAPNYFLEVDDGGWIPPNDAMRIWKFHVDWTTPANTTFGLNGQPNYVVQVAEWTPVCPSTRACVPQPGTSYRLDAIGDRVMHRAAYRNFGTHESLVVNHTVDAGGGIAGVRWYEVRGFSATPAIYQQGTYSPDSNYRWMGSIAMDTMGNMALGYSVSSSSVYPSVRYTGRLATDPLNQMPQGEGSLVVGSGVQESSYYRWGDYSMMGIDPVDDCTFWYTQEYMQTTGYNTWSTRIGAFRFPNCTQSAPGMLRGVVTSGGQPVGGITIAAQAGSDEPKTTVSASNGVYALSLAADAYTVTASGYGYLPFTQTDVQVNEGVTTTLNIPLTAAAMHTVSGQVTDAETDWPLYARIQIQGAPYNPPAPYNEVWTDPVSGEYSVSLAANGVYTLTVTSWVAGYTTAKRTIGPLSGATVADFALQPDRVTCVAPGYTLTRVPFYETAFDGGLPAGWSVVDAAGSGVVWRFDDPGARGNLTGGSGAFAIVDSDKNGPKAVDTSLRSPAFDFSGETTVILEFKYDFRWYTYGNAEVADVDVSLNGGTTWTNVWRRSGASDRGPKTARVNLSALAGGQADVRVRFRYYNANYDWWWQVDDVFLGTVACDPAAGGLIVGAVTDANTGEPLVAQIAGAAGQTTSKLNGASGDAFYALFAPLASPAITATATGYGPLSATPTLVQSDTVRQDLALPAGVLEVASTLPQTLTLIADRPESATATHVLTLTNTGGYALDFDLQSINAPAPDEGFGPFSAATRRISPKHLHDRDAQASRMLEMPTAPLWPGGAVAQTWTSVLTAPWGIVVMPDASLWINDTRWGGGLDRHYRFLADGTPTGEWVDTFSAVNVFAADMVYDPVADVLWQVNVGDDNCIYALDAATLAATGARICPAFGMSQRGLTYDPVSDTFLSGSWNDQNLTRFNRQGDILASWDTALNLAGLAYNPASGHLYALVNAAGAYDVYVLDMRNNAALLGGFDVPGLGDYEQAGLTLDADGALWTVNQVTGEVIQFAPGEPYAPWDSVAWLQTTPVSGVVAVGVGQPVALMLDATGLESGDYVAHLRVNNSTPYGAQNVPVVLRVLSNYNVTAGPTPQGQTGDPGSAVVYTINVTNTGAVADTYTVTVTGADWPVDILPAVGPLAAGASAALPVTVTVPAGALCGASDHITITLTSQGSASRVAQASLTTTANAVYDLDAAPAPVALSGDPGETVSGAVVVTNTGNCQDTFEVSTSGRWAAPVLTPTVTLAAGESAPAAVQVRIPATAQAGDSDTVQLVAQSQGSPAQSATAQIVVTANAIHAAALSPATAAQNGFIGADAVYAFELSNMGNGDDTFTVSTVGGEWPMAFAPLSVTLAADAAAPIVLTVTVPMTLNSGDHDTIVLLAVGSGGSVSSTITTTAVLSYGVQLRAEPSAGESLPGSPLTYTLWVTNTGGAADTFDLAVSGNVWTTTVVTVVGPLAAGAGVPLDLRVDVPASAALGATDTVRLTVASQADPAISAQVAVTTTAVDCLPVRGPSFTTTPAQPSPGQVVTFTGAVAAGTPPITYTWNFGGGALAVGQVVTHTFPSQTGVIPYPVVMTATNACGQVWVRGVVTVQSYQIYLPLVLRASP